MHRIDSDKRDRRWFLTEVQQWQGRVRGRGAPLSAKEEGLAIRGFIPAWSLVQLTTVYKMIALNLPETSRLVGILLILLVGLLHLYEFPEHFRAAPYVGLSFLANFVGSLVAAVGIYRGSHEWGWLLGALISGVAFVAYIISRSFGLPGFSGALSEWAYPAGTASLIVEALFLASYLAVITGLAVAAPERRGWHD